MASWLERMRTVAARARGTGVLEPIPTRIEVVEEAGIAWHVRVIDAAWREAKAGRPVAAPPCARDPFLPCDPDLVVGDLPPDHVAVLNRYPVRADHLLVVTRPFRAQDALPTDADLEALWGVLGEVPGLAFYNGGRDGGASQPHRHLQLLAHGADDLPVAAHLAAARWDGDVGVAPGLPFRHVLGRLFVPGGTAPGEAARRTSAVFHRLLAHLGIDAPGDAPQKAPYNLIHTRDWVMVVPRTTEAVEGMSVNALGFMGSLFVCDEEGLAWIARTGPVRILRTVGMAPA